MKVSLLSLITTPFPVLNNLGMTSRVGLSSDDPTALRHSDEEYQAYLTVYSPEGVLAQRMHLGTIPANRRKLFDISSLVRRFVPAATIYAWCIVYPPICWRKLPMSRSP